MREHLFISYATEDVAMAEWLTLKLTAYGYKVWCDRFELLGGERFPRDIDRAIKEKAFRLLALLSKPSLEKENPTKERTLALNVGKERGIDFLIPLMIEPLKATDLNWMVSDITYIPFDQSWAVGLKQLVEKLERINTPRLLTEGSTIASTSILPEKVLEDKDETIHSNVLRIQRIPAIIKRFEIRRQPTPADEDHMAESWPCYRVDESTYLAFLSPPMALFSRLGMRAAGGAVWDSVLEIDNVPSSNIVSNLLKKSIEVVCQRKGLKRNRETGLLYFPIALLTRNKLNFVNVYGKRTYVLAAGQRTKSGSKYRYHLAPVVHVRRDLIDNHSLLLRIRLFITDGHGNVMSPLSALSRRKHLCKNWWNEEWLNREFAIVQHLADGNDSISLGTGDEEVRFSSKFEALDVSFGINEFALARKRTNEELRYIEQPDEEEVETVGDPPAEKGENGP